MIELPTFTLSFAAQVLGYIWLIMMLIIGYTVVSSFLLEFIKNRLQLLLHDFQQIQADLWVYRACREYAKKNPPPGDFSSRDPEAMLFHAADRLVEFADIEGYTLRLDTEGPVVKLHRTADVETSQR